MRRHVFAWCVASRCCSSTQRRRCHKHASRHDKADSEDANWDSGDDVLPAEWRDVDVEKFDVACSTAAVRSVHYGPEWSRRGVVIAHARALAQTADVASELQKISTYNSSSSDGDDSASDRSNAHNNALHQRELDTLRDALRRSYDSYEAYLAAEAADGADDAAAAAAKANDAHDEHMTTSTRNRSDGDDHNDDDKTHDAPLPLPPFLCRDTAAGTSSTPPRQCDEASHTHAALSSPPPLPTRVRARFCAALGPLHGTDVVPLVDPLEWQTEAIVALLRLIEQHVWSAQENNSNSNSNSGNSTGAGCALSTSPPPTYAVMDTTMCEAFRMARVDGHVLLYGVPSPELFRVLRRWHLQRRHALNTAWQHYRASSKAAIADDKSDNNNNDDDDDDDDDSCSAGGAGTSAMAAVVSAVLVPRVPQLHSTLTAVTPTMVQETILQCFSYSH